MIFYSQLAEEEQRFDFDAVVAAICEKLIRRHPHVFADANLLSDAQIKANWENEKAKERQAKNQQENLSILADIPKSLPALSQATSCNLSSSTARKVSWVQLRLFVLHCAVTYAFGLWEAIARKL